MTEQPKTTNTEKLQWLKRKLTDDGKLVEAGFVGLRIAAIPLDASEIQVSEMRNAFFAGAQHLFSSIMYIMDEDRELTNADMRRMDQIDKELRSFIEEFEKNIPTKGNV